MKKETLVGATNKDAIVKVAILNAQNGEQHIRVKQNNKVKRFLNRNFLIKSDNSIAEFKRELSASGVVEVIKNGVIVESSIKDLLNTTKVLKGVKK